MSTPHIAGSAAVLLGLHPDWSPEQIKSALVNRADLVIKDAITGTHDVGPKRRALDARTSRSRRTQQYGWIRLRRASARVISRPSEFALHHSVQPNGH